MFELFDLGMSHIADKDLFSFDRRKFDGDLIANKKINIVKDSSLANAMDELRRTAWKGLSGLVSDHNK